MTGTYMPPLCYLCGKPATGSAYTNVYQGTFYPDGKLMPVCGEHMGLQALSPESGEIAKAATAIRSYLVGGWCDHAGLTLDKFLEGRGAVGIPRDLLRALIRAIPTVE